MSQFWQHLAQHRDVTHPGQWISLRGQQRFQERHQHAGFQHASRLQEMYRNHMYHTYKYICVYYHIYIYVWYIYIYIRQGEEVPRDDVNQDHWICEKTVFHCGKNGHFSFISFHCWCRLITDQFFFVRRSWSQVWSITISYFWWFYFLHWNYEVHFVFYIKDHWKRV